MFYYLSIILVPRFSVAGMDMAKHNSIEQLASKEDIEAGVALNQSKPDPAEQQAVDDQQTRILDQFK